MRTWRLKAQKTEEWDVRVVATRKRSLGELEKRKGSPDNEWTLATLFGLYVRSYEASTYHVRWRLTDRESQEVVQSLRRLVRWVGMGEARKAVEAVFHIKWITHTHHRFLAGGDNFEKYVRPQMIKEARERNPLGEQAEWQGPREGKSGRVSAEEFFR